MGISRFPDPFESRDDLSHATAFLVVLLLLLSVAAILYFGDASLFARVEPPSFLSTSAQSSLLRSSGTAAPSEPSTFSAPTPVPPLAGAPLQPTPNGTPTAPAKPTVAPTSSPTPALPTATPTKAGFPRTFHVGNTGGDGAYLRHTPSLSDKWVVWRDGTPLTPTGAEADGDGQHWLQVRDPRGDVGWIPAQYVVR